ncbi:type VI secretion system Vgr family protein [Azospirillum sp. B2RO_4]|uniref:type VI secretion system Vgr family protein n=1 Tax=Azospirillum sp. B2RO_4 TaxID=3027796 RepID=UPI003DA93A83
MQFVQDDRLLSLETPAGPDVLLVERVQGRESLSCPFLYRIDALGPIEPLAPDVIVGNSVNIGFRQLDGERHYVNGIARSLGVGVPVGRDQRYYTIEVVPWLSLLSYTSDCRIFHSLGSGGPMAVPKIVETIFHEFGFSNFEFRSLTGSYQPREYCVQYNETYFDFVSRLLEEEGIYYYFAHERYRHKLILSDSAAGYAKLSPATLRFNPSGQYADQIERWERVYSIASGRWATKDYDFQAPRTPLDSDEASVAKVPVSTKYELFEYPGRFATRDAGSTLARRRMETEERGLEGVRGVGACRTLHPGMTFALTDHPTASENNQPVVVSELEFDACNEGFLPGDKRKASYGNSFYALPAKSVVRPVRSTPKPSVRGIQTAFVVGPAGEEIYTDKFGRIMVQFHWDRRGRSDEKSSCWIRVAQSWAGHQWGMQTVPRVGMEVLVDFVDGDPDRPMVIGVVNNADALPTYALPEHKTRSGIKTRSSPGGRGFNEIRFEDKAGKEQVFLHAQRDYDLRIGHDSRTSVASGQHVNVAGGLWEWVGKNHHATVDGDHVESIGGGVSRSIGVDLHDKVGTNYAVHAGTNLCLEAGASLTLKVGGSFITLNAAGISMNGTMVLINSGGAANGLSAAPAKPDKPSPADKDKGGSIKAPPKAKLPRAAQSHSPKAAAQAMVMRNAAASNTPFCEICQK